MAKKVEAKKLTPEEIIRNGHLDLEYCPEPTYRFNVGDPVKVGSLKDVVVDYVSEDGKAYVVDFTNVNNNYGNPIETPHTKRAFCWYEVRPVETETNSLIQNEDVKINFSNSSIESVIFKVLHFGVDFDPEYQRGLVWSMEDKTALLDSVFNNIDIGKFAFIHNGYTTHYGYQILDGKQRLTTLVDFYLNKFPYKGKYYNELSAKDKRWFLNRQVAVGEMREATREQIIKYFIMLNTTGHVVDKEHLDQVAQLI